MSHGPELWLAGDARLGASSTLADAVAFLEGYAPHDEEQHVELTRILAFCAAHDDALLRTCLTGHLTASALVLDARRERALLTHHRKLGRWLQLGGHCDGDANLPAVAWREASEESGIDGLAVDPRPIDVDVHPIPARPGEPEHLHLDVRFVVHAPEGAQPIVSHESHDLRWVAPDELAALSTDTSVRRLFDVVLG